MRRAARALLIAALLAGCGSSSGASDDSGTGVEARSAVVATAIDSFAGRFPQNAHAPEFVLLPASIDLNEVADLLSLDVPLVREPIESATAYWRVSTLREKSSHWEVVLESIAGADVFAGPIFVAANADGTFRQVDAEEVGETVITSVS